MACGDRPQPRPKSASSTADPVGVTPPPTGGVPLEPLAPTFVADALALGIDTPTDYAPLACHLRDLMGQAPFDSLASFAGAYPVDGDLEGGVANIAGICPQTYCDFRMVWAHPDGGIVVAMHDGNEVALFTNRERHRVRLPGAVQQFVTASKRRVVWRASQDRRFPATCEAPEVLERGERLVAARRRLRCDADYSRFHGDGFVAKAEPFRAAAAPDEVTERVAPPGALLRTGQKHASFDMVCVQHRVGNQVAAGWLPEVVVTRLEQLDGYTVGDMKGFSRALPASAPPWLSGAKVEFGALQVSSVQSRTISVALDKMVSGHLCMLEADLQRRDRRVFSTIGAAGGDGCEAVVLLFDNGLYVSENGGCSGARATCSGPYL